MTNEEFINDCDRVIALIQKMRAEVSVEKRVKAEMQGYWRLNKENNKPEIKRSILMLTTHGVAEGEWDGNGWIQYRWSGKLKDSDVLYWIPLEDLTQLGKEGNGF